MDSILYEVKVRGDVDAALKLIKLYDDRGLQPKFEWLNEIFVYYGGVS